MKKTKEEQMSLAGTEEGEILSRLTERVERAITMIGELRRERDALRRKLDDAEARLRDHTEANEKLATLEEEQDRFQRERREVRNRIESILSNLEQLEDAE